MQNANQPWKNWSSKEDLFRQLTKKPDPDKQYCMYIRTSILYMKVLDPNPRWKCTYGLAPLFPSLAYRPVFDYRDLAARNCLVGNNMIVKISDFGFAKYCETRTYTLCGTPEYLAPEVLLNKGHGKPVDWWTLGILTYEMIAGIDPFNDNDPMVIYQKILRGKIKFPRDFDK